MLYRLVVVVREDFASCNHTYLPTYQDLQHVCDIEDFACIASSRLSSLTLSCADDCTDSDDRATTFDGGLTTSSDSFGVAEAELTMLLLLLSHHSCLLTVWLRARSSLTQLMPVKTC